jgi:Na+/proline symporter
MMLPNSSENTEARSGRGRRAAAAFFGIALWKRVVAGMLAGVLLGLLWPEAARWEREIDEGRYRAGAVD